MIEEKKNWKLFNREVLLMIGLFILNNIFFMIIGHYEEKIYMIIKIPEFLTVHIILEFIGILLFFLAYAITYYTFNKNSRLRLIAYMCTFLISGTVSFFHTMSYDGMPSFFTESSAAKATNFWIISRLVLAIGLFISSIIPPDKTTNLKRKYFIAGSIIFICTTFYIGTFRMDLIPDMFVNGHGLTQTKIFLEYLIIAIFVVSIIPHIKSFVIIGNKIFRKFYFGLCFAVFSESAFTLYRSVYDTYNLLGHIYSIIFGYLIFIAIFSYNLDHPYNELDKARKRIKEHADNLEKVVSQRTAEIQAVNERIIEDLDYARRIQESFLPPRALNIYDIKFISEYIPCENLSGDFYNIHVLDEEHLSMYIADVSGHGVAAAVMTVFADRIMKPQTYLGSVRKNRTPSEKLTDLYKEFNKSDFPDELHIVMFVAVYNIKTKVLSYCSGGMNVLPILVRKNGEAELLDKSAGFPICKFGKLYSPIYQDAHVDLNSGDRIILYTDGLVESYKNSTLLKRDDIINIMKENKDKDINSLRNKLSSEINKNTKVDFQHNDDITYFILEV